MSIIHQQGEWKPFSSLQGFIRLILIVDWDPLGLFGFPGALSQYDRYAGDVYDLLANNADRFDIMRYLVQAQTEQMEVSTRQETLENVVDKIFHVADAVKLTQSI